MFRIVDLFDLSHTAASDYLSGFEYPWEALSGIGSMILSVGEKLAKTDYNEIKPNVWIHKSAVISPTAYIGAPCIIGAHSEVRHCAFIRGNALIGENCVVGNSVEIKNAVLFDCVQVPHYNYVGDSILGYKAHMGAGSITSNVKSDKSAVSVNAQNERVFTGLKKCGAMLGDYAEVGCNAVLNPGSVIGKGSVVYPLSCVRGVVPCNSILKNGNKIIKKNNEVFYG